MGLLTKKEKMKLVPRTEESKKGGEYLMGLLGKEAPKIPVREVADLTPMEQLIQAQLEKLYGKTVEGGELATKHYADILKRDVDPTKSKEYKGFLTEAERLRTKGKTDIRHSAELGGMLKSTPRVGAEAEYDVMANSNILQFLGQLEREERDRKERAAGNVGKASAQDIGNVAAIGSIASEERRVQEMKNQALYTAALQQVLFPYVEMANIASALLNVQNQAFMTGGGLSDLGVGLSIAAGATSSYMGAKAGAATTG